MPTPSRLTSFWNFGSILGLAIGCQLLSGVFLAFQYVSEESAAFLRVNAIIQDTEWGWWLRAAHANGASLFFVAVYFHISRGMYFSSARITNVWLTGVVLLLLLIAIAFLGYVLPWGQISFWGATVITNLISAVPYVGLEVVWWVWGGFRVGGATLTRFFTAHFIAPFVLLGLIITHLLFLHETGSRNPVGLGLSVDKIPFHPYFYSKDFIGFRVYVFSLGALIFWWTWSLGDRANFSKVDPLVTPSHIKPEWYFLFAYAILRSIPNKLGGVLALVLSIIVLFTAPILVRSIKKYPIRKVVVWIILLNFIILSWIGAKPVEPPYVFIGQVFSYLYFIVYGLAFI